jgi:hypothetical protein
VNSVASALAWLPAQEGDRDERHEQGAEESHSGYESLVDHGASLLRYDIEHFESVAIPAAGEA